MGQADSPSRTVWRRLRGRSAIAATVLATVGVGTAVAAGTALAPSAVAASVTVALAAETGASTRVVPEARPPDASAGLSRAIFAGSRARCAAHCWTLVPAGRVWSFSTGTVRSSEAITPGWSSTSSSTQARACSFST
ncbi:hypothetical protein G6F24_017884 [Rhizopus arrhizus]|nr:hypothetical protein G6F24_017884 [Rhizopus arrhizus]